MQTSIDYVTKWSLKHVKTAFYSTYLPNIFYAVKIYSVLLSDGATFISLWSASKIDMHTNYYLNRKLTMANLWVLHSKYTYFIEANSSYWTHSLTAWTLSWLRIRLGRSATRTLLWHVPGCTACDLYQDALRISVVCRKVDFRICSPFLPIFIICRKI